MIRFVTNEARKCTYTDRSKENPCGFYVILKDVQVEVSVSGEIKRT
jgi:hypothetical protein